MPSKISDHKSKFLEQKLTDLEIKKRIKNNIPTGFLLEKWTHETAKCPACGQEFLDKFTGGANVESGDITHTEFIYHCRVCDVNLTQEEYERGV